MKYTRRAAKRDEAEPAIVAELQKQGWTVERELPVDLVCLKWVDADQLERLLERRSDGLYRAIVLLEVKTPQKNGRARKRKDQEEQTQFCLDWHIGKPTSAFEAKLMLGEVIEL